jgi:enoyl-CoA hydratase/carnithine racemase
MSSGRIRAAVQQGVGWLVLDNAARRNAINAAMWAAIPEQMKAFGADPAVRCVVFRGEGTQAFAAGADISEFAKQRASDAQIGKYGRRVLAALRAIERSAKPVIAMIHGYCMGGGAEIALACDLRYCGESAEFAIPAARLSLAYGVHGTARLVATVGHAAAREMLYTARRYGAEEALALGLVNRVLPDEDLEAFVLDAAQQLAENAPLSIAASKAVLEALVAPQGDFRGAERALRRCMRSEDYAEGRRAFMEKRKPRFRGR